MVIFETPIFTRKIQAFLEDDEYAALQYALTLDPELGDNYPGVEVCAKCVGLWPDAVNAEASG